MLKDEGYDFKADIWSLGVMLFLLITGLFPFEEKNIMKLRMKILQHDLSYNAKGWCHFSDAAKVRDQSD